MIWIFVLAWRISSRDSWVRSLPSNQTVPEVGGGSWSKARPVVDLPQPDSPTMPSVSPGSTSKLTSDTAWTFRRPAGNSTTSFSTRTSDAAGSRSWAVPLPAISDHESG